MHNNIKEKRYIDALYEILDRILMLSSTLHDVNSEQAYVVYAAYRILEPLEAEMIRSDKIRNEEHEAYIKSLIQMECPFNPNLKL